MSPDTIGDWTRYAALRLGSANIENPLLEAQVLAAHACGESRSWVLAHPEATVPQSLEDLLRRRIAQEPLAYLTGVREFYGRPFHVGPGVLVPRQETEAVVELALSLRGGSLLDIGTGSGCLAVTLALERPDWTVTGCDISRTALHFAERNATELGARVTYRESNLVQSFAGVAFDLIVTNPPYIREKAVLPKEVSEFEPACALFGGDDGLAMYRRLAAEIPGVLRPGAALVTEIGDGMRDDVLGVFKAAGWQLTEEKRDLLGHPRVLAFTVRT